MPKKILRQAGFLKYQPQEKSLEKKNKDNEKYCSEKKRQLLSDFLLYEIYIYLFACLINCLNFFKTQDFEKLEDSYYHALNPI